jgi:hypothetical protein
MAVACRLQREVLHRTASSSSWWNKFRKRERRMKPDVKRFINKELETLFGMVSFQT